MVDCVWQLCYVTLRVIFCWDLLSFERETRGSEREKDEIWEKGESKMHIH